MPGRAHRPERRRPGDGLRSPDVPTLPFDHARAFGLVANEYAVRRPTYPEALFDWIAAEAPARTLAIDVATGGGQGARGLLSRFDRVIATDHSAELLATLPADPRLRTLAQPAEDLDVGEPADVVTVFQALHWFAEPGFFERVRRTLRPGGRLFVVGYAWFNVDAAVDKVVADTLLAALAPYGRRKRAVAQRLPRCIGAARRAGDAALHHRAGLTREALLAYASTWSAVSRSRELGGIDPIAATDAALAPRWPTGDRRRVTMPLAVRAFRA